MLLVVSHLSQRIVSEGQHLKNRQEALSSPMAAWSSVCLGDTALLGQDFDTAVQEIISSFPLLCGVWSFPRKAIDSEQEKKVPWD